MRCLYLTSINTIFGKRFPKKLIFWKIKSFGVVMRYIIKITLENVFQNNFGFRIPKYLNCWKTFSEKINFWKIKSEKY
jgi:hypothetical protein